MISIAYIVIVNEIFNLNICSNFDAKRTNRWDNRIVEIATTKASSRKYYTTINRRDLEMKHFINSDNRFVIVLFFLIINKKGQLRDPSVRNASYESTTH